MTIDKIIKSLLLQWSVYCFESNKKYINKGHKEKNTLENAPLIAIEKWT